MNVARSFAALALCLVLAVPGFGQTPSAANGPGAPQTPQVSRVPSSPGLYTTSEIGGYSNQGILAWFSHNYLPRPVRPISWTDSPRLERLMRAGTIYLSLRDAIALVLENNLDIEDARFNLPQAEANLLRASAGQLLTNVSNSVSSGPSSASGVLTGSGGFGVSGTSSSSGTQQGVLSGLNVQLAGSAIPALDPAFFLSGGFTH